MDERYQQCIYWTRWYSVIDNVRFPKKNSIWANSYKTEDSNGITRDNVIEKDRTYPLTA